MRKRQLFSLTSKLLYVILFSCTTYRNTWKRRQSNKYINKIYIYIVSKNDNWHDNKTLLLYIMLGPKHALLNCQWHHVVFSVYRSYVIIIVSYVRASCKHAGNTVTNINVDVPSSDVTWNTLRRRSCWTKGMPSKASQGMRFSTPA